MRLLCEDMEFCGRLRWTYGQPGPNTPTREVGSRECRLRLQLSSSFRLTIYREKCVRYLQCLLLNRSSNACNQVHCSTDYLGPTLTLWTKRDDNRPPRVSTLP